MCVFRSVFEYYENHKVWSKKDLIGWFLIILIFGNYCKYRTEFALVSVLDQQTCQLTGEGESFCQFPWEFTHFWLMIGTCGMTCHSISEPSGSLKVTEYCSLPWIGFPRVTAVAPEPFLLFHCVSLTAHIFKVADSGWDKRCDPGKEGLWFFFLFKKQIVSYMNQSTDAQAFR